LSTYLYRVNGMITGGGAESFSIPKYVVHGIVRDEHGVPVEGAALHIGKQIAYSDSMGHFMVRFSKRGTFPMTVAPEEFLTNGFYEVVSGVGDVKAGTEDMADEIKVVVRQVPRGTTTVPRP
jgi:hypothetical protein